MEALVHLLMVFLILANLRLLGGTRLNVCIVTVAAQGAALGLLPILLHPLALTLHALIVAGAAVVLKGWLFPMLLKRALRDAGVEREVAPYVGFTPSLLFGVLALGLGAALARKLPLPAPDVSPLLVPVALATMLSGLFLIVARRQALMQVVGYLALENGIFAFGAVVMKDAPLLVEMGILLDIFVAVFVMGIMVFHISREFDHTDTDRLSELKDWTP